jgi:hypothetical protein
MSKPKEVQASVFRSNATDCSHRLLKFELTSKVCRNVPFPIHSHDDQGAFQVKVYDLHFEHATVIMNMSDKVYRIAWQPFDLGARNDQSSRALS